MERAQPTPAAQRVTPVTGGCVRIGIDADPGSLLPYATASAGSTDVQGFLFQQLAELGPDLVTFRPRLAESWEWGADPLVLDVHLRTGLRWSDGAPLDAADVVFSFEVACDPRVAWNGATWKSRIESCTAVDARTVRFRFSEAYPDRFIDANAGFIVPRHALSSVAVDGWSETWKGASLAAPGAVVGCGPFRLAAWEPGERLVLERNPHYEERGLPRLDRVEFVVLPDPESRLRALRDGAIDILAQVPEREAAALRSAHARGTSDVQVLSVRGRHYDFVCYNPRHPALHSRDVRRALTLAVDRPAIIETFCSGFAEPFESPIVPILWAYDPDLPLTPYDPAAARALLESAGWVDVRGLGVREKAGVRLEFELLTNRESARRVGAARVLVEYWQVVGARCTLRLGAHGDVLAGLDARRYDAALSGWRARLKPDLEPMWGCSSVGSKTNRVDYCNPDVDRLNAAALGAPDLESARRLFAAAQRLVAQDHPYTWLYYLHDIVGVRSKVRDARIDARGVFLNPQEWWLG